MKKPKRYWILDANGEPSPASRRAWLRWCEVTEPRVLVAVDWLELASGRVIGPGEQMGFVVSTMFLGFDDDQCGRVPLLYETTLIGGPEEGPLRRYATREEAVVGHREACEALRAALDY